MATRRMIASDVITSDKFLEMSPTSQALYFHMILRADDDGFLNSIRRIMREVNCRQKDMEVLIDNGYIILFESGIAVITHWHIHNKVRADRKKNTVFIEERLQLDIDSRNIYILVDNRQPTDNLLSAKDRLGEESVGEVSTVEKSHTSTSVDESAELQKVADCFNSVCKSLPRVTKLTDKRKRLIKKARSTLGEVTFEEYFKRAQASGFLTGKVNGWRSSFDWLLDSANITKVIEGNYDNKPEQTQIKDYSKRF